MNKIFNNAKRNVLIAVVIGLLIAATVFLYLRKDNSTISTLSQQSTSHPTDTTDTVSIKLIDTTTGKPLANTDATFRSDNGIRCEQAPCPTNVQTISGVTDKDGVLIVPRSYMQHSNSVTVENYSLIKTIKYDKNQSFFSAEFNKSGLKK